MAGNSPQHQAEILAQFPFEKGQLPVRYLGLPLLTKRMVTNDYKPLIEKIRTRISSWTVRSLLHAGRLQLIQSVIMSLTKFWLNAFRLPGSCLKEIESLCAAFLWSGPALQSMKAKVSWEDIYRPKREGGLGIKKLKEVNTTCCLKLIWRLTSSYRSLWAAWLRLYLVRKGSIWQVKDSTQTGSWMWRKILKARDLAKYFHKVEVHDGKNTFFRTDWWSSRGRIFDHVGFRGSIELGIPIHASLHDAMNTHRRRHHRRTELNEIEEEIERHRQTQSAQPDIVLWRQKEQKFKCMFSMSRTWNQIRDHKPEVMWSSCVWFSKSSPKFSFMLWLAIKNRLATGDRFRQWNQNYDASCVLCNSAMESKDHLFFTCTYSSAIWEKLARGFLGRDYTLDFNNLVNFLSNNGNLNPLSRFIMRYAFQTAVYNIWRERNCRRHGDNPITSDHLVKLIDSVVRNRLSTLRGEEKYAEGIQRWFELRNF